MVEQLIPNQQVWGSSPYAPASYNLGFRESPRSVSCADVGTGRGADRQALSLGYVSEAEAGAACEQMNIEEDRDRVALSGPRTGEPASGNTKRLHRAA